VPIEVEGGGVEINEYFAAHRGHVLGRLYVGRGVYGADELMVASTGEVAPALRAGLGAIAEHARVAGLTMTFPDRGGATPAPLARPAPFGSPAPFMSPVALRTEAGFLASSAAP
jgi:hypothetical protein